jgi:hypothetical protein
MKGSHGNRAFTTTLGVLEWGPCIISEKPLGPF